MIVRVRAEARIEMLDAQAWYEAQRDGLGAEFADAVDAAVRAIGLAPLRSPPWRVGHPYRRRLVTRFPYAIYYRLGRGEIVIVACVHQKRRPGSWLAKKPR